MSKQNGFFQKISDWWKGVCDSVSKWWKGLSKKKKKKKTTKQQGAKVVNNTYKIKIGGGIWNVVLIIALCLICLGSCAANKPDGTLIQTGGLFELPDWLNEEWFKDGWLIDLFYKKDPDKVGENIKEGVYTITFEGNGGELVGPSSVKTNAQGVIENLETTATRKDYLFDGWYTKPEGGTRVESMRFGDDMTLYAHWTDGYVITLDANGGSFNGLSMKTVKTDLTGELTKDVEVPTRKGHAFDGWVTEYGAELGESVMRYVFVKDTTVKAQWRELEICTITFNGNGGTVVGDVVVQTNEYGKLPKIETTAVNSGYAFSGWFTAREGGEGVTTETIFYEDMTLYAHWIIYSVEITFDANGGDMTGATTFTTDNNGYLQELPKDPTRDGFVFLGWALDREGKTMASLNNQWTYDRTLYAQWREDKTVTVTFDANGGEMTGATTFTTDNQGYLSNFPTDPTREGYTFLGWYEIDVDEIQVTLSTCFSEDVTVYAQWRADKIVTVAFDGNGGTMTGTTELNTNESGYLSNFPAEPMREGYAFRGWYTRANGGEKVTLSTCFSENITLYAQWRANQVVTVTFDATTYGRFGDGGTIENVQTGLDGRVVEMPTPTATDKNYVFAFWNTEPNARGSVVNTNTMFDRDTTVYAYYHEVDDGNDDGNEYDNGSNVDVYGEDADRVMVWSDSAVADDTGHKVVWLFDTPETKQACVGDGIGEGTFFVIDVDTSGMFKLYFETERCYIENDYVYVTGFDVAIYSKFGKVEGRAHHYIDEYGSEGFVSSDESFVNTGYEWILIKVQTVPKFDLESLIVYDDGDGEDNYRPFSVVGENQDGIIAFIHTKYDRGLEYVKVICADGTETTYEFNAKLPYGGFYTISRDAVEVHLNSCDTIEEYSISFVEGEDGITLVITDGSGTELTAEDVGLECRTIYNDDGTNTFDFALREDSDYNILSGSGVGPEDETDLSDDDTIEGGGGALNGNCGYFIYDASEAPYITVRLTLGLK